MPSQPNTSKRKALYFSVRVLDGATFDVMRVTRVTPRRVYGSCDNISTHCAPSALYGNFETEAEALVAVNRVQMAHYTKQVAIDRLANETKDLEKQRDLLVQATLDLIKCK